MTTFRKLGLKSELIKSLDDLGFVEPSPIQEKAIPFILEKKEDLIALAQTGTGKTAAFSLPILNTIEDKALTAIVLCPTRELCLQISKDIKNFTKYLPKITVTPVYGGERIETQIRALRRGTNIVVGTPGRVCDMIRRKVLNLQAIEWLVLDEADEMLDMGFKEDLDAILKETPKIKRTLLFSATISNNVSTIAKHYMNTAQEIVIGEKNIGAEKVDHKYYVVQSRDRFEALRRILDSLPEIYGIVFCRTRNQTQEIADKLKQDHYNAEALHGDISQNIRTKIMTRFKNKQIRLLVATDVAARGIDVNNLSHIINYNLPDQNGAYTHRSGRTGRAKKSGISISILNPGDVRRIKSLESIIGKKFEKKQVPSREEVYQKQIDGFITEIEEMEIDEVKQGKELPAFIEKLNKIDKEKLINYLVAQKFSHLTENYKNARDLNTNGARTDNRARDENKVNLEINLGKKQTFDVRALFSLINSNRNLKNVEIGRIELGLADSIFSVEKNRADEVIRGLKGIRFKGKRVTIKRAVKKANSLQKSQIKTRREHRRKRNR